MKRDGEGGSTGGVRDPVRAHGRDHVSEAELAGENGKFLD